MSSNGDLSSQLQRSYFSGRFDKLADFFWTSDKVKNASCSVLRSELTALTDAFDTAYFKDHNNLLHFIGIYRCEYINENN